MLTLQHRGAMFERRKVYALWPVLFAVAIASIAFAEDVGGSPLDDVLSSYDTLHHDSFKHHVTKRDLYSQFPKERRVEFDSLGRHFKLVLKSDTKLLTPDFRVVAIDADNKKTVVDIKPSFYHGYLADEPNSSFVNAYWDDDDTLTASIRTENEVYVVEPSWRHLPNSSNYSMISYKRSDVSFGKDLGPHFCGAVPPPTDQEPEQEEHGTQENVEDNDDDEPNGKGRQRRQASRVCSRDGKTACHLLVVADYKFYDKIGLKDLAKTTRYLIGQMDYIDSIYRSTSFGPCRKMGFAIKEIRIHKEPSVSPHPKNHRFNTMKNDWDTTELLQAFSADESFKEFCLALFTHIAFQNGVLGLAYIGSSRTYSVGGICSPSYHKGGEELFLNTGWSSSLNRYHRPLLTEELRLVTAHEFGHNWGSEHDPDTSECAPSGSSGGKYIMYTYSVSGMDTNNKIFSPCSRRAIGSVLSAKADTCFTKPEHGFCGNSRVEPDAGEECDAGPVDDRNPHSCCDSKCKLIPPAVCSDTNSVCCDRCHFASSSKICYSEQHLLCEGQQTCNGYSADCPKPPPKPDGTKCLNNGHCRNGDCLSLCEYHHKLSCLCDAVKDSCKWCCKQNSDNSSCVPFSVSSMSTMNLPEGMPCIQGYCDSSGVCIKQVHDMTQRLWNIIENITVDQLVMFMRANIVGTVIVLSLVIWIPASCVVAYVDRRNARMAREDTEWRENTQFVKEKEPVRIIQGRGTKRRPMTVRS